MNPEIPKMVEKDEQCDGCGWRLKYNGDAWCAKTKERPAYCTLNDHKFGTRSA